MVNINVQVDCGNSPKAAALRDFNIAFAKCDRDFILESIADDIDWEMMGQMTISGRAQVEKELVGMLDGSMTELVIENVITHGDVGSVNGTFKLTDGKTYGFCDVYTFTSHAKDAKIKSLKSYVVDIKAA